jgi:Fic family protein
MKKAHPEIWMLLGEAKSKCEHIAAVPLRPVTAKYLHHLYIAKGILATTAIEGNTLSEEEVQDILKGKLNLPPSREYLKKEIENIETACNYIKERMISGESGFLSVENIKEFNRTVLNGLSLDEAVIPGMIRKHKVTVGRYRAAPPKDCEYLLERLCKWLNGDDFKPENAGHILVNCFIKAIVAHLYLAWIHPFGDGNGRTARLVELQILLSAGVPTPAAHLMSNFYNQTRQEYYRQLDKSSRSGGDVLRFIKYALHGFADELKAQLEVIRNEQWDIVWRNYVHEKFKDKTGNAAARRRRLVLDLSHLHEPVPESKLRGISPRVAEAYATRTGKTLSRDLGALVEMGLIERTVDGVHPKREIILAFLPDRRASESD